MISHSVTSLPSRFLDCIALNPDVFDGRIMVRVEDGMLTKLSWQSDQRSSADATTYKKTIVECICILPPIRHSGFSVPPNLPGRWIGTLETKHLLRNAVLTRVSTTSARVLVDTLRG